MFVAGGHEVDDLDEARDEVDAFSGVVPTNVGRLASMHHLVTHLSEMTESLGPWSVKASLDLWGREWASDQAESTDHGLGPLERLR